MSDVPEGYKMSEVGVIPEEWEVNRIKNIASITTGAKNTQDKIDDGEYPFYVRSSIIERINSYSFDGEAVLTAGDGVGTGKVIHYINGKFDFHQRVYKISDFREKIEGYFFYLFFSNYFLKRIMAMTAKSSVDSVRMEMIAEMPIPLPPLPEQQAIASALSDVDALITALEQLIIKKRNIKQGTVQQLITGKKRLPGFGGEWEVQKVSDFTLDKKGSIKIGPFGSQLKRETLVNQGYKVYGQENVYENNVELGDRFISTVHFNKLKSCELHPRDFVISMMGTIGKCMIMPNNIQNGIMDSHLLRLQLKNDNVDPIYLSQLFISSIIFNQIKQLSVGGIMDGLSSSIIQQINFPLPSLPEQQAIAQILSDMDTEIEALEQKRGKYKAIKQGMMQELLTGKRRLA